MGKYFFARDLAEDCAHAHVCVVCGSAYVQRHAFKESKEGHANPKQIDICASHEIKVLQILRTYR